MFIDWVTIEVEAGDGGRGCISFRREKYAPRGGPDGGDGGDGGSIYIQASRRLKTLGDYRYKHNYRAKRGAHGQGSNKAGKGGPDVILKVPCGTVIKEKNSGDVVADLVEESELCLLAKGGRGGRGNARFANSVRQAPRIAEEGRPGQKRTLILELKLLAEVGLIGLPNAGKSTLLSRISRARPKIADYPFTTLTPNLGVVEKPDGSAVVVADIPGLIEGAHQGAGLGDRFLRHIERTKFLVHIIGLNGGRPDDWLKAYQDINRELAAYSREMAQRPQLIVINKIDLPEVKQQLPEIKKLLAGEKLSFIPLSAATGFGLEKFLKAILYAKIAGSEGK